jgi:hypothetical protein
VTIRTSTPFHQYVDLITIAAISATRQLGYRSFDQVDNARVIPEQFLWVDETSATMAQ